MLTYGEMFAGYGGLGMGVQSVLGGEMTWCAEFDAAPSRILAHHWPDVPNLGDVTKVDWATAPKVDVITGGSPCQDLSHAGKRAGMTTGTRSNLWVEMREAIATIRPRLVVWENVRGAYSACADSEMGSCPRCVGDDPTGGHAPSLRALGRVLGDLSELGYDSWWVGLRASDVGGCHGRFRVFIFATSADAVGGGLNWRTPEPERIPVLGTTAAGGGEDAGSSAGLTLLPTPAVNDMGAGKTVDAWDAWDAWTEAMQAKHGNGNGHGKSLEIEALRLFKTPTSQLAVNGGSQHPDKRKAGGHGPTLADEVEHPLPTPRAGMHANLRQGASDTSRLEDAVAVNLLPTPRSTRGGSATETAALLPTPRATDGTKGGPNQRGSSGDLMLPSAVHQLLPTPRSQNGETRNQTIWERPVGEPQNLENALAHALQDWAQYEAAIRRQEALSGRPAPLPTEPGPKGGARLSPHFVEWMMWLPEGHVTDPAIWDGMTDAKGRVLQGDRLASAARNAQLKALGNGVVTAQAAAATRWWLAQLHATKAVA